MIYKFIDNMGSFSVENPHDYNSYFPLTNESGTLLSSISPNLGGDIKQDNEHFLTLPVSIEDLRSNPLCQRDFFIKTTEEVIRLSRPYQDRLEAGILYHKIIKKTAALNIEILNFIPHNMNVEVMRINVTNRGKKPLSFIATSFIPLFGRSEKNIRDHRHVSSLLNRVRLNKYGILLSPTMIFDEKGHKENKTIYYVLGYEDKKIPPAGQFPTLDYFYGKGDIFSPDAVIKDSKPALKKLPEFDGKEACAAFRFRDKKLDKDETVSYFFIMGIAEDKKSITANFNSLNSALKIEARLKQTKKYWHNYLSGLTFKFKNKDFDNWLLWVKLQPVLRKLFGCSFLPHFDYGKGGRGWRDLWQDALTLLLTEPDCAKNLISNSFRGVRIDGSNATIITGNGDFISDRNRLSRVWMDHGIWPYLTLRLYINRTADLDILNQETTYFKDHLLKRAKEKDTGAPGKEDYILRAETGGIYKASILEHLLVQNLIPFFNVGKHNIIRLENADWNDGLDMAAEQGESVAFSFMYAHNLLDLCFFLEKLKEKTTSVNLLEEISLLLNTEKNTTDYDNYKEKLKTLDVYLEKIKNISGRKSEVKIDDLINDLKSKANHLFDWLNKNEWLAEGFFNGYYDNTASCVEGRKGKRIRMMLTSQVFPLMSNGINKEKIEKIWLSVKKYLKDKKLGGFRLNTNFKALYMDLGRAFGFSYGDKENGAFFSHMVVMLGFSLYKAGLIREGHEVINSLYKMAVNDRAQIYPLIPEYFNSEGKGLYLYLSGSASWYIYTLVEEILGVKCILGNLVVEPKLGDWNFENENIEVECGYFNKKIKVCFIPPTGKKGIYRIKKVLLEENPISHHNNRCVIEKKIITKSKDCNIKIEVHLE